MTDTHLGDEGFYICNAINSKGSQEAEVHLRVIRNALLRTTTTTELPPIPFYEGYTYSAPNINSTF